MNLTQFALRHDRLIALFAAAIVVFGMVEYLRLPSQEDPTITIREAVVTTRFPGMSPDRVEDLITRRIEEKIREIPEVEEIRSQSKTGTSIIHVKVFDRYFDLEPIWQDLRNKMDDVRAELPDGTRGPEVEDDYGNVAVATIAITADGFSLAEMRDVSRDLRRALYALPGVKRVDRYGVQEERIYLETTDARLARYGLSPYTLIETLQNQNIILPGGTVDTGGGEIVVEPSGNFETLEDIERVVIALPSSDQVTYLRDIVTIRRAYVDPPEQPVYYNGRPAIVLAVSMIDGNNILAFGKRLERRVREFEARLPIGYVLDFATWQPALVERSIRSVTQNLYQTLAIVLAVVMVFLGLRTGLIVGAMVPMTMLAAVVFMAIWGIPLQRVSLAAMIISLGLLVDNGVVIAENIRMRLEAGSERAAACIGAGRELAMPLLTSSLTTIFAFLPLILAENVTGEFTISLAQVLLLTLLSSWVLAMTATPLFCYWFMRARRRTGGPGPAASGDAASGDAAATEDDALYAGRFYVAYRRGLAAVLRFRWLFLGGMAAAFAVSLWGFQFVTKQFFPPSERAQFMIFLDLEQGVSVRQTDASVRRLARWLNDREANPEILDHIAYVGSGGPRFYLALNPRDPAPHRAFILANLKPGTDPAVPVARARRYLADHFPELEGRPKAFWLGPTEIGTVEVRFSGPDADRLYLLARRTKEALRAIPGTIDIRDDWENRVVKMRVEIDQAKARRAGLTSQEIANSINGLLSGIEVTDFREGDETIPIVLRGVAAERFNLDRVRTLSVYSASRGTNVPLLQVADFHGVFQYGTIRRRDLERTITVSAKHEWLQAAELVERLRPVLAGFDLPDGYAVEFGGEVEKSAEAQSALAANAHVALAAILIVLMWQFNSLRRTAIILLTIPLSLIGAVIGLLATDSLFGFMAILGLASLAGIIINNAIVLIERIDRERELGRDAFDAILWAAAKRLRPIVMTTLTTILGLLPLILLGGKLFYAMANVIAFGLGVGTVLTLGVVPVLYSLFFRVPVGARGGGGEDAGRPA